MTIAFESGTAILTIPNRIFVIGSKCITKQAKYSHMTKGDIFQTTILNGAGEL